MANKKQPAKKIAYKKRKNISRIEIESKGLAPAKVTNKDTEVELLCLKTICSIFDNWNEEQKRRNLTYLCGLYYDFM